MPFEILPDEHGGYAVSRDGHPQSYVHLQDPGLLVYEYVQHLAMAVDTLPAGPLRLTHVGGAGLSFARYVQHTRPGSPQIVLEPDVELTAAVREQLPLPRRHRIRVRAVDGLAGVSALRERSADVVVVDAFDEGRVPGELAGTTFAQHLARVLVPGGLIAFNTCDDIGLRHARSLAATLGQALPHLGLIALKEVLSGRRFGNVVILASDEPLAEAALSRRAASAPFPTTFLPGVATRNWLGGAQPFGASGIRSPVPPDPGAWRRR